MNNSSAVLSAKQPEHTLDTTQTGSVNLLPPTFINAFDVLNAKVPEHKFLVEGIIPLNVISLLCGPSDTGKSILARQIAVAAALGRSEVAGFEMNLTHQRAIYVSTEDGIQDWKEKLTKYDLSTDDLKKIANLTICFEYKDDTLKQIEAQLKKQPVDVIVVDVFSDTFSQNINDSINVRSYFNPFKSLLNKYGCNIIFVHHITKKGEASAAAKTNVVGSQAIEAAMRCVLELRDDPQSVDHRYLSITKSNYLAKRDKEKALKLLLKPTLEFEFQGERVLSRGLNQSKSEANLAVIKRVLELKAKDLSIRKIEQQLIADKTPLGRSRINEIIIQGKRE